MSKVVCIYPHDITTDFLRPLCVHICETFRAEEVGYDTSDDDDPIKAIFQKINDAQIIFFLGHGRSTCLYASTIDNVELFNSDNIHLLRGKQLFLLACDSNQLIKKFKLNNAVGFGFLPTSIEDVRNRRLHNIDISYTGPLDIDCFNKALVNSLVESLSKDTILDYYLFKERMLFSTCTEIVKCLINRDSKNFRIVADELFYLYKDMEIK